MMKHTEEGMMFYACSSCGSYVKERDPACPFCGTARAPQSRPTPRRALPPGMSRGQWLVLGSALAVAGCYNEETFACPLPGGTDSGLECTRWTQYCKISSFPDRAECIALPDAGACPQSPWPNPCSCHVQDAGEAVVVCQGGCYGAPPARLERLAAS
jgi:DNA-directed RNA polymerase subunit RPC12/RpoP